MASFVFLTGKSTLEAIAGHPVYRDLISILLYGCSVANSGQISRHVEPAYGPDRGPRDIAKFVRTDLHLLVRAGLLGKKQLLLPDPMLGPPFAEFKSDFFQTCDPASPLASCRPSAEEMIDHAHGRTPWLNTFKTLNVYYVTENTPKMLSDYGDPSRRLPGRYGEMFSFGVSEFYFAEDLTSDLAVPPKEIAAMVEDYDRVSTGSSDLGELASHDLVAQLAYSRLLFRERDQGTDGYKDIVRNVRFYFLRPKVTKAELRNAFIKHLQAKEDRRLGIW